MTFEEVKDLLREPGCPGCQAPPVTGRSCHICLRGEAWNPGLKWTRLPPVKALDCKRPDVCTECNDDMTLDMRDQIAAQHHDVVQLRQALQDAAKLLDVVPEVVGRSADQMTTKANPSARKMMHKCGGAK
jgi:hypothetical protein